MTRHEKESWYHWKRDYFLERPIAVICEGCGKHYPKGKDAAFMRFEGYRLIECSECQRLATPRRREIAKVANRITAKLTKHIEERGNRGIPTRCIARDVALRYRKRFKGYVNSVQTDADNAEFVLYNRFATPIAKVSSLNRFQEPKPDFSDMPF